MHQRDKDKELLGISWSGANYKLHRLLLFRLAGDCGLNICFRCHSTINSIQEFSIEHKTSWRNAENPAEEFFNVENLAFSHTPCNTGFKEKKRQLKSHCPFGHEYSLTNIRLEPNGARHCRKCDARNGRRKYTTEVLIDTRVPSKH